MGGQHGAAQPGDNEHTTELPDHSRTSRAGATLTVTVEGQPQPPSQMPTKSPAHCPRVAVPQAEAGRHSDICGSKEGGDPARWVRSRPPILLVTVHR